MPSSGRSKYFKLGISFLYNLIRAFDLTFQFQQPYVSILNQILCAQASRPQFAYDASLIRTGEVTASSSNGFSTKKKTRLSCFFIKQDLCHSIHNRTVSSQLILCSATLKYTCSLSGWSVAEIKCTLQVALPKRSLNQFELVQQSRQEAQRAHCPNLYTVHNYVPAICLRL